MATASDVSSPASSDATAPHTTLPPHGERVQAFQKLKGTGNLKMGLADMFKGGVIMDVGILYLLKIFTSTTTGCEGDEEFLLAIPVNPTSDEYYKNSLPLVPTPR